MGILSIFHIFRLVRFPNLVIIALTQYAIRFGIILPFLRQADLELFMSETLFGLLVGATVLIAAAGYIINDYFDVKLDHVNKPKQMVIGKHISRRLAMTLHTIVNVIGIGMAFYVAKEMGRPLLVLFQLIPLGALWFYSVNFKKQILIGNLIIAGLTALVPFTAGYYELMALADSISIKEMILNSGSVGISAISSSTQYLMYWVVGYSVFAFILTLVREIVKDCEDIEGDEAFGCKTLPIVHGIQKAKNASIALLVFLLSLLGVLETVQFISQDWLSFGYFIVLLSLPLIWLTLKLNKAKTKRHFFIISQVIKVLMLVGILYTVIIYLFQA